MSAGVVLVVLVIIALAAPPRSPNLASATSSPRALPPPVVTVPAAAVATATSAPTDDGVTGLGSLDLVWESRHTPDPRFQTGSVYDPEPGLGPDPQHNGRYYAVVHDHGRVISYSERLPAGTSEAAAKAAALAQLPPDTRVAWFAVRDTCAQMSAYSATLGAALADPEIGDQQGGALVEFSTETQSGDFVYRSLNVNDLIFLILDEPSASSAPGC